MKYLITLLLIMIQGICLAQSHMTFNHKISSLSKFHSITHSNSNYSEYSDGVISVDKKETVITISYSGYSEIYYIDDKSSADDGKLIFFFCRKSNGDNYCVVFDFALNYTTTFKRDGRDLELIEKTYYPWTEMCSKINWD